MQLHRNAKTTPKGRALIVQRVDVDGWTVTQTAGAFGVSVRTVHKWRARHDTEGLAGLLDRDSTPHRSPERTSQRQVAAIVALRTQRLSGTRIAQRLGVPRSTVGVVLRRLGLGRLRPPAPPLVVRYERARPGELLHVDMKALGRIVRPGHRVTGDRRHRIRRVGWDHVHVAIDDASRVAYVEILPSQQIPDAVGFVARAAAWFGAHGVPIERVMTDNGSAYRSHAFAALCAQHGMRHLRTRPYTPRTNGKAERFIQTLLREWAYSRPYATSARRRRALEPWLRYYNQRRPHSALCDRPPISRLQATAV